MDEIVEIINSIDSDNPNINPTEIYNEGWMTRILVKKSVELKLIIHNIDFSKIRHWTSEALISSPFIHAPDNREGYTHVDMALGDFIVNYHERGEIVIKNDAELFGILEAKMKSNLSQGTKYAENYNQASRNLVCIAKNTLMSNCQTFFGVVGPKNYLAINDIEKQIKIDNVLKQVEQRFNKYNNYFQDEQKKDGIISKINKINIFTITYEEWIEHFNGNDKNILQDFYKKASMWNRL